jgi:plasmid stabilization system protein ParE
MVAKTLRLVIDNPAKVHLQEACQYIRKDSVQHAEQVKAGLLASFKELLRHPQKCPLDKYRLNNDGSYRAYELFKYRISYHVTAEQVTILRIRHTKMNPQQY